MVDIETYRARIGSFGVSGLSTSKLKLKIKLRCPIQRQVSMECSVQTLIFLCMVASMMLCVSLHYQEQGNTYTGTTPSHTDSLYSDTQLCIKCLFEHVHELYRYILESYVDKLTEMSLFYTPSHRSSLALNIWTPGTDAQTTLMKNVFNGTVHGTCSYLIGNIGSHAYHGNPPKKSGPHIWDLHSDMVLELSETLAPSTRDQEMERKWRSFTNMLYRPDLLSRVEVSSLKDMYDVFGILMEKGKIDYGNYEVVKKILSKLQLIQCLDIITEYEDKMSSTSQDGQQGRVEVVYARDTAPTSQMPSVTGTVPGKISFTPEDKEEIQDIKKLEKTVKKIYNEGLQEVLKKGCNIAKELDKVSSEYERALKHVQNMKEKFQTKGIEIDKLEDGCLQMTFTYSSYEALHQLYTWYTTKDLHDILHEGLITEDVLNELGVTSIKLDISISEEYFSPVLKDIYTWYTTKELHDILHEGLITEDVLNELGITSIKLDISVSPLLKADLRRDDVTAAQVRLSTDVGSLQLEQGAIGKESRSLQKNVDGLAEYARGFGTAGTQDTAETVYSQDTAETRYSRDTAKNVYSWDTAKIMFQEETAASSHNKMPSVDMEASVKVWRSNDKLCYETKGIKDVVQKIYSEEHSYICVVGEPGCGKSTAIRHAALYLKDKLGFIIYPVSGPKQFIDYLDPDKPQVGVIDDIIGEYFIDQDKLKLWDEYNEKIKDCLQVHKNTKVLFSLRVQLHSELKSKGNTHIYNDQRHVINFSDKEYKLSRDTMQDMLRHYLQVQHVQNIEGLIREVKWGSAEQFAGCFPLLCKVFSEDKSVRVDPEKYFSDPWPALQNIFKRIKSDNKHQFCGLLLCGVTDLKDEYFSTSYKQNKPQQFDSLIESQTLDPRKDLSDIKSALQALDGVYISHIGNRYTFLHSIFQNIVTFLYDDKYYVFKYATLDFIHTRVRLFSKFDTDDDYVKVFYDDDCVELLVDRMIEELRSDDRDRWEEGASFIVWSHYIDNKELITCLMEKLFDSKHTQRSQNIIHRLFGRLLGRSRPPHTQITQYKIDELFGLCLLTVRWYKPSPPHTDVTSCPQYQLLLSLIARCDCNKQIEGLWLGYPLLESVYWGLLPVTKALVEHQADVNVVDRDKLCVLHHALNCTNNVDMTKYLLSLPNLKCLNHRDMYGHTPYWYVVNNKSPRYRSDVPHRDELMKLYKHTAAICK